MEESNNNPERPGRRKGLTSTTLGWLAERMRKAMRIKEDLERGDYQVNSESVAKAMLSEE